MLCYLNVNRPKTVHKSVKFRAFRKIPVAAYQNDVKVVLNNQSKTPDNINNLRVLRSAESNLLTVPPGKPGKYGSRSFVRASANLWNSLRGEKATSSVNGS